MSQAGVIEGLQFARGAMRQSGVLGMAQLPRLAQMSCSTSGLEYVLQGGRSGFGKPCLRISVTGKVQLVCQRCLGLLPIPIAMDVELQLADSLQEIAEADDDIDRVLASKAMDIGQLIEDEVILELPTVPKHDICGTGSVAAQASGSSFGGLAVLKGAKNR